MTMTSLSSSNTVAAVFCWVCVNILLWNLDRLVWFHVQIGAFSTACSCGTFVGVSQGLLSACSEKLAFFFGLALLNVNNPHLFTLREQLVTLLHDNTAICFRLLLPIIARKALLLISQSMPVTPPSSATIHDHGNSTLPSNMSYADRLTNFAYLYGTFPTAPSVAIYASKFNLEIDRVGWLHIVVRAPVSLPLSVNGTSCWFLNRLSLRAR